MKHALISGINPAYLAELFLAKGWEVHAINRRASIFFDTERIEHLCRDPPQPDRWLVIGEGAAYDGILRFDPSKPDGSPRKQRDTSPLQGLGLRSRIPLQDYEAYLTHLP